MTAPVFPSATTQQRILQQLPLPEPAVATLTPGTAAQQARQLPFDPSITQFSALKQLEFATREFAAVVPEFLGFGREARQAAIG